MKSKKHIGILYILMAAFCFASMNLFVRLSGDVPVIQKSFFRNIVAAFVAAFVLWKDRKDISIQKSNIKDLLIRSISGTVGVLCNFYAIDHLSISDASMLNKLSPFFCIILSTWILKEKSNKKDWFVVIVAFIGALFVVKPSFNAKVIPAIAGVIGGFGAGLAYTFVRKLGKDGVKGPVIVLFFSAFSCLSVLPYVLTHYQSMEPKQLACLLLAGVAATGGQFSVTAAYTYAPAKRISVYDYSQVIFAAILGFFVLGQVPDWISIIGYFIIISAAIVKWVVDNRTDE